MNNTAANLSAAALAYFDALADDAGNWSGTPLIGGNVEQGPAENGYLTALKKAGLLSTYSDGAESFAVFSPEGVALAAERGFKL